MLQEELSKERMDFVVHNEVVHAQPRAQHALYS